MTSHNSHSRTMVLLATAVVVVLGGMLAVRLLASMHTPSAAAAEIAIGPAVVPRPASVTVNTLEVPCWSCPNAKEWAVDFRTDLDLLAPLGEGPRNVGLWFKDFAKPDGPRFPEAEAMMKRRSDHSGELGMILAPDDPLLLEAEPWSDQATMSYYPEIFPLEGYSTRIPNLLVPLTFVRSWVARGLDNPDPERGLEDCRRAIRLGRLLRQEDVTIISDLVGLACIHLGSRGVYDIALRTGDLELALLASIVIGEVAPQRLMTSERVTRFDFSPYVRRSASGEYSLDLPAGTLNRTLGGIDSWSQRRFFGEAVLVANLVYFLGAPDERATAEDYLSGLLQSDDEFFVYFAKWAMETPPDDEFMNDVMGVQ